MSEITSVRSLCWMAVLGIATLAAVRVSAEETSHQVITTLQNTTISGYIDTSAQWNLGAAAPQIPEPSTVALLGLGVVSFYFGCRSRRQRS